MEEEVKNAEESVEEAPAESVVEISPEGEAAPAE